MNTAAVFFRTKPEIKTKAQKTASELGISLSVALNGFLREFVKTKTVTFTPHPMPRSSERGSTPCSRSEISKYPDRKVVGAGFTAEELTPYAKKGIKKAMDDLHAGKASPTFNSAKDSIEWLEKQGI